MKSNDLVGVQKKKNALFILYMVPGMLVRAVCSTAGRPILKMVHVSFYRTFCGLM